MQLKKLEGQQSPPKYAKKIKELEETKTKFLLIRKKITDSRELLRKLSNLKEDVSFDELQENEKKFCNGLSEYLASAIGKIYYLKKWYVLERVDFIGSQFIVEKMKHPIKFEDLSTGRSQTTALITQLKQNVGGRIKIVLFDEIQILDRNSFQIVVDELENQAKSGELLLAILARVDDTVQKPVLEKIW